MKTKFKQKLLAALTAFLLLFVAGVVSLGREGGVARAEGEHTDTEVTALELDGGHIWFKLSMHDYTIPSYNDGGAQAFYDRLNALNTLSMIEFDGKILNTVSPYSDGFSKTANDPYINLFGKNPAGFNFVGSPSASVTIKAGCEFPSYAYASGTGTTVYATTKEVTFVNVDGAWLTEKETKPITNDVSLMLGVAPKDDIISVAVKLLKKPILPNATHVNDNATQFPVDLAQYILIGDKVENGRIANERTAREIVADNAAGKTNYSGTEFPMSIGGIYSPIDMQTSGGELVVFILKDYKPEGAFSITVKSGFTVTDGEYNYTIDEDIIYSYNAQGIFTRFYEIAWNINGTETKQLVPSGTQPEFGGSTDKESSASKIYTFAGWATEENGEPLAAIPNAAAHATYWAKYTESVRQYDVTFDTEGQMVVEKVDYNTVAEEPAPPVKAATAEYVYTFEGWYDGDEKWDFSTPITENLTLKARFKESTRQYDVTFDGGAAERYDYGSKIEKPADPTKEATAQYTYVFEGWYNGDEKWDFENGTVTSDVRLVSRFTETLNRYTVTISFEGLEKEQVSLTLDYGANVDFFVYVVVGYEPKIYNGDAVVTEWTVTGDAALKIVYTAKQYDVTFDGGAAEKYDYGSKIEKPADPTKEATARYTYVFEGWYNGDEKWDFENGTVTSDVRLVSRFTETLNRYTVTISFEGLEKEQVSLTLDYGANLDLTQYAEDGYTYVVKNGESEVDEFTVTGETELTVVYTAVKPHEAGCGSSLSGAAWTVVAILSVVGAVAVIYKKRGEKREEDK